MHGLIGAALAWMSAALGVAAGGGLFAASVFTLCLTLYAIESLDGDG